MSDTSQFEKASWKPGIIAETGRVLDITDPKWGHPEAVNPWYQDPSSNVSTVIVDPATPDDERVKMATEIQALCDTMWTNDPDQSQCDLDMYEFDVPGEPGVKAQAYVITPLSLKGKKGCRTIFNVLGGALICWVGGEVYYDQARQHNAIQVMVRYRLAWEAQYPAAINDLHAGYEWMLDNADMLGIDPDNVCIFGGSSGAHLAASLGFRLKRFGHHPKGIVLMVPQTDDRWRGEELKYAGIWDSFTQHDALMIWLGRNFASDAVGPEALANHATVEDCIGYPPCFITTGELDPDSDFNLEFYKKLKAAHVFCEYHSWGGTMHTNSSWASMHMSPMEPETEFSKLIRSVMDKNIEDCLNYDLRRMWLVEE